MKLGKNYDPAVFPLILVPCFNRNDGPHAEKSSPDVRLVSGWLKSTPHIYVHQGKTSNPRSYRFRGVYTDCSGSTEIITVQKH
ncbi:Hypothetical protein PP7435_CHR2-2595 [Komagataella phaffii CBS 7435]|uniref:Uncharacterized protein n=2 Tax=Komagataella phaffii TaxID=460519 RepID=C4QZR0_KOMPG|nr:Hypothetical protein PAS_chr2-1_0128 [Komagataella phaffii GS115]CAH2448768.1 Hypothetical protein BQ9382_C2-6325 [Komagataella phaffii CBS 7435]CAY68734.1 Hypothetical protein PAS_chr2-1_0128 [Komagataella phaffii GS115]SCV12113.1 Hypothetical protein PP7435_CHR2-2595 [Komagataella phaffii CBS 7435]